ncbi:hypothetical protein NDU88_002826 [Pleurodeles waltl]|uniref:Uncharacterized protein n=1 Tax=Pleurodeles waltl TaxID=8319 RepID=A0AAV7TLT0_PLEWA|nr:hypothetical protein NDU88_002826 [Pleurodeles waltl]
MTDVIIPTLLDNTVADALVNSCSDTAMERILQEISAVGRRLETMDSKITHLSADSKSIRVDFASFQAMVSDLDHCLHAIENQMASLLGNEPELQYLRHKLTDLEDRTCRDNVCFLGLPAKLEGADTRAFLCDFIPNITSPTFSPSLEFQCAHRFGPLRKQADEWPRPALACFL